MHDPQVRCPEMEQCNKILTRVSVSFMGCQIFGMADLLVYVWDVRLVGGGGNRWDVVQVCLACGGL